MPIRSEGWSKAGFGVPDVAKAGLLHHNNRLTAVPNKPRAHTTRRPMALRFNDRTVLPFDVIAEFARIHWRLLVPHFVAEFA